MSISFNKNWHIIPTMNASGSCSTNYSGSNSSNMTIYGTCTVTNKPVYSGSSYGYNVTSYVSIDGVSSGSGTITKTSPTGSGSYDYSLSGLSSGYHSIEVHMACGQTGGCSHNCQDVVVRFRILLC